MDDIEFTASTPTHGQYHNHHNNLSHHHNFHHQHTDQTKSLQELQNEVGALLEFRDLVIETFPDLKHKMASSSANSTIAGLHSSSSIVSRREWEPGIRVRRKLGSSSNHSKDGGSNASSNGGTSDMNQSSSLLIRSRSNSHCGKKEPKSSGEGNGSVIQDSGFSTETSSDRQAHSASSTAGSAGQVIHCSIARFIVPTITLSFILIAFREQLATPDRITPKPIPIMNCGTYSM